MAEKASIATKTVTAMQIVGTFSFEQAVLQHYPNKWVGVTLNQLAIPQQILPCPAVCLNH